MTVLLHLHYVGSCDIRKSGPHQPKDLEERLEDRLNQDDYGEEIGGLMLGTREILREAPEKLMLVST